MRNPSISSATALARTLTILLVHLLVSACREAPTRATLPHLTAPAEISITTYAGGTARVPLELQNNGRGPASVVAEVGLPFSVQPAATELGAGETRLFEVTLSGTGEGLITDRLRFSAGAEVLEVIVRGRVLKPPHCDEQTECASAAFDPDEGLCELASAPDGTECEAACVSESRCVSGICAGVPVACDDGDACTVDACEPASGCVSLPRSCPAPEDPCLTAACDPASGCTTVAAPDGTSCGPAACDAARVCLSGECVTRRLPDGAPCGERSPCQDRGTCQSQVCVRPPAGTLTVDWEHTATHSPLKFQGDQDAKGNLYWTEAPDVDTCDLVSVTSSGVLRFRVNVSIPCSRSFAPGLLLGAEDVVMITDYNRIESRWAQDGRLRWARSLDVDLAGFPDRLCPDGSAAERIATLQWVARASDDSLRILAGAHSRCGSEVRNAQSVWLIALTSSGTHSWSTRIAGLEGARPLLLDSDDGAYFVGLGELHAYSPDGAKRWTVPIEQRQLLGIEGEALFLGEPGKTLHERRRSDGALVREIPLSRAVAWSPALVLDAQQGFLLSEENDEVHVGRFERAGASTTRIPLFTYPGIIWDSDVHLTREGRMLFALSETPQTVPELFEATPEGELAFRCALDVPTAGVREWGASALGEERWFHWDRTSQPPRLRAYRVPGRAPATSGWVNGAGSTSRSFAPR